MRNLWRRLKKPKLVSLPTDSPTSPNLGSKESNTATSHPFLKKKKKGWEFSFGEGF